MNIVANYAAEHILNGLTAGQELAVMPANLAKRLLKNYVDQLVNSSTRSILNDHAEEIRNCGSIEKAVQLSVEFVAERTLIANIENGDWDAYKIESIPAAPTEMNVVC